jgi:hypothetical protein
VTKGARPGRCRLAIWIPVRMRNDLQRAAAAEKRSQREIVEAAVRAYCARALPAKPATP